MIHQDGGAGNVVQFADRPPPPYPLPLSLAAWRGR